MNDKVRNEQMVEAHAVDQQEQTVAEQAAAAGLDAPEFLRRKTEEERKTVTTVEPLPLP